MPDTYTNKLLVIDLSRKSFETIPVSDLFKTDFIGGKGFGAKLLSDMVPPGTDPLGKDNPLMFMTGPLTGTMAPAMRGCVVTKSPLTGIFLDSYFGGSFSPEIKYAGFDGIIIKGQAKNPVYIWINDDHVEIRDARHLWGTDILESNRLIKNELRDETIKIAGIGQAGENQVLFALIGCEYNRQAGRGGAGAVMGSKNLKAIAIKGSKPVAVHDPKRFQAACAKAFKELEESPDVEAFRVAGTAASVDYANETGLLPHKNYQSGTFSKASQLSDIGQSRHIWLGSSACMGCPIRCSKIGAVRTGKYKGIVTDIVEYESAALMGANLDISDIRAVAHLVKLCDLYGMDSMSTGNLIGFAMEACEKGLIKAPKGIELTFGNVIAAEHMIHAIAGQKGKLGKLLSKGVKQAARKIGGTAVKLAVHTKGLESPAWGPRGVSGMGLAYMTTDRGGCHQRGFPVSYELAGEWEGKPLDPLSSEGKAQMVIALQNYSAGRDTLVNCDFGSYGISAETYAELLSAATGKKADPDLIIKTGERIWNLVRCFNLAQGLDAKKDILPHRFVKECLPDGPSKGHRISEKDMDYMRQEYYQSRGWDKNGVPLDTTLNRLGIGYAGPHQ
ncbi:MAG: aldehyde ferredoxin oxidoreductase family protein [Desulfobacula sp.]|jgi:aldehyde:ferredoxin oxidoreductase|uniref:aldehyde ferredoxin oxidoreductase family protein n=2 Tax=Desulfobacula sp. TaxID=2593537 RepID=UPI001DB4AFA3|nr:aldehyde ferredoxin oxidoreductase family protein [Desulfobacula sp.]MBT3484026.1 aldehyde ferredoxin oxidoreductase family protein [Desulfobacula sp.]MBT3805968.1 aldehyde ferredoxin oxidoreductase family protein [Desulfobacula sp.]MBT4026347.1 aldehyde ferredoxin oxidoreductase family protein [Desulfobacula sp.]MBT4198108.1 aldehyde ferredoxin oxidoreductase family protein [Desulfobacula sp.]